MKKLSIILPILMAGAISSLLYGFFVEPSRIIVRNLIITAPNITPEHENLTIVFLTDIHYKSSESERERMRKISDTVSSMDPDIVLLGGDYVFGFVKNYSADISEISKILSSLKNKNGIFAVSGNHDYASGGDVVCSEMAKRGIHILDNENVLLSLSNSLINIGGVSYVSPDFKKALSDIDDRFPSLFIMHSPEYFGEFEGCPSAVLSGHTHGGQMLLPLWSPSEIFVRNGGKYERGVIRGKNYDMFVSVGLGCSIMNFRFITTPEIVRIKFRKGAFGTKPSINIDG